MELGDVELNMKKIELSRGKKAIVVDDDFERLIKNNWYTQESYPGIFRAVRYSFKDGKSTSIQMTREILNAPVGKVVDHINRNTLDNRKKNLRICTQTENLWNSKIKKDNTSGFKGVYFDKQRNKWMARMRKNKKRIFLGRFDKIIEAANAYIEAAKSLHGEFYR